MNDLLLTSVVSFMTSSNW